LPANTSVLRLSFTADTSTAAAQIANDFAKSYLYVRGKNAQTTLDAQIKKVSGNISAKTKELHGESDTLAALSPGSKLRNFTQARRALLITQISNLTTQYNQLSELRTGLLRPRRSGPRQACHASTPSATARLRTTTVPACRTP
jgi:hypothetical protein